MKTLNNLHRYLSEDLISKCFFENKVTHVDKQVCGNGFSTGFIKLYPKIGSVNIIIAPNKAVIEEKQASYLAKRIDTENKIKFFYQESTDKNFHNADILFFVADSFLLMQNKIKEIAHRIDKVLIDEYHTVEIGSRYRYNLIDFENKVKDICNDKQTSITTVTATPNLFSKINIRIINEQISPITIYHSKDREMCLERVKIDLKNKEKVLVFTNSRATISKLKNRKRELESKFIVGDNLSRSLTEGMKVREKESSNLVIVSSKGFEGWSCDFKDAKVYFFEDRSTVHESFFISNLIQAINRVRTGATYIEYCRHERSVRRGEFNVLKEVDNFVNDKTLSVANKQKAKYRKFKKFVVFNQTESEGQEITLNETSIKLQEEELLYDKDFPTEEFKPFLESRKISIKKIEEVNNRIMMNLANKIKIENLLYSAKFIRDHDLCGDSYKLQIKDLYSEKQKAKTFDNRILYLKKLEEFLRYKNYDGTYEMTPRQIIGLELLSDEDKYNEFMKGLSKQYNARSINKYGLIGSRKWREDFKKQRYNIGCQFIFAFCNKRIALPSNWISNRDYNISTKIGVDELNYISEYFGVKMTEVDIVSAFSRVIYALNDLSLPVDFYGENKENKKSINIFLNNFFYNDKKDSSKKLQKHNAILKFRRLGFDEKVINWLIANYFEPEFRGDIFEKFSFHEKKIINTVLDNLKEKDNDGLIRRHDSVIIFNNRSEIGFLNDVEFMEQRGWFNVEDTQVIKLKDDDRIMTSEEDFDEFFKGLEDDERKSTLTPKEYRQVIA